MSKLLLNLRNVPDDEADDVRAMLDENGIASRLAKHVLADAKARDLLILPVCPFFSAYLQKHPEHADVVHPTYRGILGL